MNVWLTLVVAVMGGFIGGVIGGEEGFLAGLALGLLTGGHFGLRRRFNDLAREFEKFKTALESGHEKINGRATPAPPTQIVIREPDSQPADEPAPATGGTTPAPAESPGLDPWTAVQPSGPQRTGEPSPPPHSPRTPRAIAAIEKGAETVKRFFTGGNVVTKVGVVILFFGVAFLLRYAVERNVVPIELRLAVVAAGGVALLIVGWRLRFKRLAYALVLQGGGVGVLYLTVFASARLYHVIPLGMAFALMVAFVVLSAILAVLQIAPALVIFGTAGGFLAPVLTSTGHGSHIALFSYYALLNAGIVGIAWFRAWRILNWVGFVFTFVIGASWGYKYYAAEYFVSTEPFLILFFLFYVAITVLFARRQPPHLKGLVDGTLVFGVPIVGFALQSGLAREFEFGHAYSALALGLFYIGLAKALWRRQVDDMRLLTESFLALGVVFGSLAIPLALDGRWTAAAWSLEAAGIVWVGLRQHRILARAFGLLLQIGAALLFLTQIQDPVGELPIVNSAYVGCVLIGIAGLFTAHQFSRHKDVLIAWERPAEIILLTWGLGWWLIAGLLEIDEHLPGRHYLPAAVVFFSLSAVLLGAVATRVRWRNALQPAIGLLPVFVLLALYQFGDQGKYGPWRHGGQFAWAFAFAANYAVLRWFAKPWRDMIRTIWHAGSVSLITFILTWASAVAVDGVASLDETWALVSWGALPAAIVAVLVVYGRRVPWPVAAFPVSYQGAGLIPLNIGLVLWVLASCWWPGDPAPLPYLPVANPVDLIVLFAVLALLQWWRTNRDQPVVRELPVAHGVVLISVLIFFWLNAVVARTVHHAMEVPYTVEAMWRTPALQTAITLAWAGLGCLLMALAGARLRIREIWLSGAGLLGIVVAKLFLVDLADIGTIARIVSFIGVGLLLLVIGYFAPIPPRSAAEVNE